MEKIKIVRFYLDSDPDFKELVLWFTDKTSASQYAVPVNDETTEPYHAYMYLDPETGEIPSAFFFPADNLFDELARAFANKDLNHPDVRFFLEKKLEQYAERHAAELTAKPALELAPQAE